jgi:hypothetical protein
MKKRFALGHCSAFAVRVVAPMVFLGVSAFQTDVFAADLLSASYSGITQITGNNGSEIFGDSKQDLRLGLTVDAKEVQGGPLIQFKGANLAMAAKARSEFGSLGVSLDGFSFIDDSSNKQSYSTYLSGSAQARFLDAAVIDAPERPAGRAFIVDTFCVFKGNIEAEVIRNVDIVEFNTGAFVDVHVKLYSPTNFKFTTIPHLPQPAGGNDIGSFYVDESHRDDSLILPAGIINIRYVMLNGEPFVFDLVLEIAASVRSMAGYQQQGDTNAFFNAAYADTLTWGGITKVTDFNTGEVITDWTITSESGFDYSKPFPVPEPHSCGLLLGAVVGLMWFKYAGLRR